MIIPLSPIVHVYDISKQVEADEMYLEIQSDLLNLLKYVLMCIEDPKSDLAIKICK